jgi:hypothetical protein
LYEATVHTVKDEVAAEAATSPQRRALLATTYPPRRRSNHPNPIRSNAASAAPLSSLPRGDPRPAFDAGRDLLPVLSAGLLASFL